jgi:hypothetical protein
LISLPQPGAAARRRRLAAVVSALLRGSRFYVFRRLSATPGDRAAAA